MKTQTHRPNFGTGVALAVSLLWSGSTWAAPLGASNPDYTGPPKGPASMTVTGVVTVDGAAALLGVEVAVRDPRGTVCGASGVDVTAEPGEASFLIHVYGDDDTTAGEECATPGESLTFEVYVPGTPDVVYGEASLVFTAPPWVGATPLPASPVFTDRASYAVSIDAANRAPIIGTPESLTVAEGGTATTLDVGGPTSVLDNDSDPEGGTLTAALGTGPAHATPGGFTLNSDGTFSYTHDGTEPVAPNDTDAFTYTVSDGVNISAPITVTIAITPVDDPPVVGPAESFTVAEGGTATTLDGGATSVLDNDVDPEGGTLSAALGTGPAFATPGGFTLNTDGTFTYTHDGTEPVAPDDTDGFTYTVSDGFNTSAPITVTIAITPVNDPPLAVGGETITVAEGGTATALDGGDLSVLDNDSDPEGVTLTAALGTGPAFATPGGFTFNTDGTFSYTHDGTEPVAPDDTDGFTYTVSDGFNTSAPIPVTIAITPVNDDPVLTVSGATVEEGVLLELPLSATDADSAGLAFSQSGDPTPGASIIDTGPGTATFSWTPPLGSRGDYSVTFTVTDDATPVAGTDSVAVTITVTGPVMTVAVPLRTGWNLISFPVAACFVTPGSAPTAGLPSGMTPGLCTEVTTSIAEAFPLTPASAVVEQVRSFDGNGVHNYDPALGAELNDLTWVAGGYGYLVKVSADCTASFTGERLAPAATLELAAGWNLVGYWGDGARYVTTDPVGSVPFPVGTPASTQVAQADLLPGLTPVAAKSEDLTGEHVWGTDLDYTGPGYGYWVKLSAPATLHYGP